MKPKFWPQFEETAQTLDRRRSERLPGGGPVRLILDAPPVQVYGCLKEISYEGFRAVHSFLALQTGHIVHFVHEYGRGRARVVWTRIVGDEVESAFEVLRELPSDC